MINCLVLLHEQQQVVCLWRRVVIIQSNICLFLSFWQWDHILCVLDYRHSSLHPKHRPCNWNNKLTHCLKSARQLTAVDQARRYNNTGRSMTWNHSHSLLAALMIANEKLGWVWLQVAITHSTFDITQYKDTQNTEVVWIYRIALKFRGTYISWIGLEKHFVDMVWAELREINNRACMHANMLCVGVRNFSRDRAYRMSWFLFNNFCGCLAIRDISKN